MKYLLNSIGRILFLLIVVGIVGVLAFSLQQKDASPDTVASQQSQSDYPAPPTPEDANAYPGAPESTNNTSNCIQNPQWKTFTDHNAGYSLEYPNSARLSQSNNKQDYNSIRIVLDSSCFDTSCRRSDTVKIVIWKNQENLLIKDFVHHRLSIGNPAEEELAKWNGAFDILENGGRYIKIANQQAIRIQDTNRSIELSNILGLANPRVFVPHGNLVLEIYVRPPEAYEIFNPCGATLNQFNQILESLQLFPGSSDETN